MVLESLLLELAEINYFGAPFLVAYGITWLICGVLWQKLKPAHAALGTLFQGMVALPFALLLMALIGAFQNRPEIGLLNDLVIIIAMSQLLALPLLIQIFRKEDYSLIPFVFSAAGAVHFLMYAWLYQSAAYIVMPILIAIVLAITYEQTEKAAARACFGTGILLLTTAIFLLFS
jgi:hypothetical protein